MEVYSVLDKSRIKAALGIDWRLPAADIILSQKDLARACLADNPIVL